MATFIPTAGPAPLQKLTMPDPDAMVSSLDKMGFATLALYLLLLLSRAPEWTAIRFGTSFYQIFIMSGACFAMMIVSGRLGIALSTRLSMTLLALHFWYLMSVPFSYWRTGAVEQLTYVARLMPVALFLLTLISTEKQLRATFAVVRVAMLVILYQTLTAPITEADDERLQLDKGRFANSNEIATYLLIGMPFWIHLATSKRYSAFWRIVGIVEIGLTLYQCLRTGSRGALITIVLVAIGIFLVSSAADKMKLAVIGLAVVLLGVPLLSRNVRDRLMSLSSESAATTATVASANDSTAGRTALLMESIRVTASHPIVGVGIGVYAAAAAGISDQAGVKKLWQVSHNMYTQVSAECGLPALALFIACLWMSGSLLLQGRRLAAQTPGMEDTALMLACLFIVVCVYAFNGLFTSMAQEMFFYMAVGFAGVGHRIASDRFAIFNRLQAEMARRNAEGEIAGAGSSQPAAPADARKPVKPSAEGRPRPIDPDTQYGGAPWARSPRRS